MTGPQPGRDATGPKPGRGGTGPKPGRGGTGKQAFLDRLRSALAADTPAPHRPFVDVPGPPEVTPIWPNPDARVVERWTIAFEALGGIVHRTTERDLASAVHAALDSRGPVLVDERGPVGLLGAMETLQWPGCGLAEAATALSGVIDATGAIAATGSIVVDTERAGRLVSLLPRVAVFLVPVSAVVATTGDVLRHRGERWPDGPPSNVVLITGPSRSGDIEMSLVVGVHGPGEVHAVLVEDR